MDLNSSSQVDQSNSLTQSFLTWLKRRRMFFLLLITLYGVLIVAVYSSQRYLQYFPSHIDTALAGTETFHSLKAASGTFLGYVKEVPAPRKTILFFHGNGGEAIHRDWVEQLDRNNDINIILAEYPGYGGSPGKPTEEAIFARALETFDEAQSRYNVPILVIGESLGTGVASYVASKRPAVGLELIAPFTSAVDLASSIYWFIPVRILMSDRFDSSKHLQNLKIPLRIVHGTADEVIPVAHAQKLYEQYPGENKAFEEIPGFGHNDIPTAILNRINTPRFWELIEQ